MVASQRKPRSFFIILSVLVLLAVLPCVSAVWDDSTGVIWVSQGETVQGDVIDGGLHSVKVIDSSLDENMPFIEIKKQGVTLYKGFIEPDKPVEIPNEILVEYLGSSERYEHGNQIKLRVFEWVDGRITGVRFPRYMNGNAFYDVWMDVENTGTKEVNYRTELTQDGRYDASSGRYILADGQSTPILLDFTFPSRAKRIPAGNLERVEYNEVAPNRAQQSLLGDTMVRAGKGTEKSGIIVFRLFFKNTLLDEVKVPDVSYGKSPSGFINDIWIPDVMLRNTAYDTRALLTNGGPGGNNIDTGKLNLQLMTKGFEIGNPGNTKQKTPELQVSDNLLRKNMVEGAKEQWRFSLTPRVPTGDYDLEFRLWQNRYDYVFPVYDIFTKRVKVVESITSKLIQDISVPTSVNVGDTLPVDVKLSNSGGGQLVNVNLHAPTLLGMPIKRVVTLPIDTDLVVPFDIPAGLEGPAPIIVEVYSHKATNYKYGDPYAEAGPLVDSAQKTVQVLGLEDGESLPPLPVDELPPQGREPRVLPTVKVVTSPATPLVPSQQPAIMPTPEVAPVTAPKTPVAQPFTAPAWMETAPGLTILAVLVVLIVLLSLRVIINHQRRKNRMESHRAVLVPLTEPKRKK